MLRIALRILKGNQYDAEDAVHDAFLTLVTHISDLPDHDSEFTQRYVFKMAKNAALMIYRKRYGEKEIIHLDDLFEYPDNIDIPRDCANQELFLAFVKILNDMSDRYRDVLSMYWLDGYKPQKIARLLHRPTQTVYKQIQRGNQLLQEHLDKEVKGYDTARNSVHEASTDGYRTKRSGNI